ncbi:hypothetical protein KBC75_06005 [Candidatus Shapirobacteria bacterium]|nr:hypothetical protein [Candidatus Shapirobacteria bacterium]
MPEFIVVSNDSILAISTTVGRGGPSISKYRVVEITPTSQLARISIEEIDAPLPRRTELIGTFVEPSKAKILSSESFYGQSDMVTVRCFELVS